MLEDAWSGWFADLAAGRSSSRLTTPWAADNLGRLHDLVQAAAEALVGNDAGHNDLRPDNIVIDRGGAVRIYDWNWLALGPVWTDLVGLLVTVPADHRQDAGAVVDADRELAESRLSDGLEQRDGVVARAPLPSDWPHGEELIA